MKRNLLCLLILFVGIFIITGCSDTKKTTTKKTKASVSEVTKKKTTKKKAKKVEKKKKTSKKSSKKKVTKKETTKKTTTKKKETKKEEVKDTIAGSYEIIELKDGEETYNKKIIDSLNLDYSFEVKDDKTAVMKFGDQEENLTYDDKYFINEKEKVEYKYENGKLVLTNDDTVLTFKKK